MSQMVIMRARFLKNKYCKISLFKSSSVWKGYYWLVQYCVGKYSLDYSLWGGG